jgi:hypothetical protein
LPLVTGAKEAAGVAGVPVAAEVSETLGTAVAALNVKVEDETFDTPAE